MRRLLRRGEARRENALLRMDIHNSVTANIAYGRMNRIVLVRWVRSGTKPSAVHMYMSVAVE